MLCPQHRSLGAKIALHVGVFHGAAVNKIIADAGSAGGVNSTTAVLDMFDHSLTVLNRAQWWGTLLKHPSNLKAICQWLLVSVACPSACNLLMRIVLCPDKKKYANGRRRATMCRTP
jgi:hypothetical protein